MNTEALLLWTLKCLVISCIALAPFFTPHGSSIRHCGRRLAPIAFLCILLAFPLIPAPHFTVTMDLAPVHLGMPWLFVVWMIGFSACGLYQLAGYIAISRVVAEAKPLPKKTLALISELPFEVPIPVLLTDAPYAPAICGLFRPAILVPTEAIHWRREQWRDVLNHELAHLRAGDLWTHFVARVSCSLGWMNPVGWLLLKRFTLECEHYCDSEVVKGGSRPESYARMLLNMSNAESAPCAAMARMCTLEERIRAVCSGASQPPKKLYTYPFVLLLCLALAACTFGQAIHSGVDSNEVQTRLTADPFPLGSES